MEIFLYKFWPPMNVLHHTPSRKLQQIKYCTQLQRRNMTVQYTASCFVHCHNYDSYLIKSYVIIQIMWCISVTANVNHIMCPCINVSAFHLQGAFVQYWTHALQLFKQFQSEEIYFIFPSHVVTFERQSSKCTVFWHRSPVQLVATNP